MKRHTRTRMTRGDMSPISCGLGTTPFFLTNAFCFIFCMHRGRCIIICIPAVACFRLSERCRPTAFLLKNSITRRQQYNEKTVCVAASRMKCSAFVLRCPAPLKVRAYTADVMRSPPSTARLQHGVRRWNKSEKSQLSLTY